MLSLFGNHTGYGIDAPAAMEGYTENGGDMVALEEALQDMHSVIESMHEHEMAAIECAHKIRQGGNEESIRESYAPVMENAIKNVYDKLVEMLKKLWAKLKGYFKNVVRFFDGLVLSGKKFVQKYEKDLANLSLSGFEFKMYKWDNNRISADPNVEGYTSKVVKCFDKYLSGDISSVEVIDTRSKEITNNKEKILNELRGSFVGGGSVDSEDYAEKLFAYFRGGATEKADLEEIPVDIHKIIAVLKEDKMLTTLKKAATDCDKVFNDYIKDIEKQKTEFNKILRDKGSDSEEGKIAKARASFATKSVSIFNEGQAIAQTFLSAWKTAVSERNRQYKAATVAAFGFKEEK